MIKQQELKAKSFIETESLQSQGTKVSSNEKTLMKVKSGRQGQLSSNKSAGSGQHRNVYLQPFDCKQEKLKLFAQKLKA